MQRWQPPSPGQKITERTDLEQKSNLPIRRILFISHVDSYFTGFIDLIRMLENSTEFKPVILFPMSYPNLARHIEICKAENIEWHALRKTSTNAPASGGFFARAKRLAVARIQQAFFELPVLGYLSCLIEFNRKLRTIRHVLLNNKPDLLVLGGDIVGHDMAFYIRAGHELEVPSVLLPGWMASPREPAELYFDNPRFLLSRPMNWLLGYFFPRWVYTHRGRALVRQPAQQAFAMETLGLAPPLPWILHSGFADRIAVESKAALQYGLAQGLSNTTMVVTGSRAHDKMHDQIVLAGKARAKLCRDLGLAEDKPVLLSALPPDQLYGPGRPECEFSDYRDLVKFWISSLQAASAGNAVINLHPSTKKEDVEFIAELGAMISDQPVAELIPLCDYYVACISATIQWAIACGKPVINYDVYRYRYTDYQGLKGVLTIEKQDQFLDVLHRMASDGTFRNEIAGFQKIDAPRWGNLDGNAGRRILALFDELIEKEN
jgi:hypothetical protein